MNENIQQTVQNQSAVTPGMPAGKVKKNRKKTSLPFKFLRIIIIILIIWWINNFWLFVTEETITSSKVNNEIKIAVMSDLHASTRFISISNRNIISKINNMNPDVVCVLGDMHSSNAADKEKEISFNLMKDIVTEGYKLFFVLGEHDDRSDEYVAEMEKSGINVLDQECEIIRIKDTPVTFYGISNAWFPENFDLNDEFRLNPDTYNVLLAHIPMFKEYEDFGADLTLCADTHGGIIQIPFLGPAYYDGEVLPELFNKSQEVYDKGLFRNKNGYLFITSGIGNSPVPARFNNFPEICEITVRPE